MLKTSLITFLITILVCNVCHPLPLPLNNLGSLPYPYKALAFKPTQNNIRNNTLLSPINYRPTANAGLNQTVYENATVVLNGVASDPNPGVKITYSWRQIGEPVVKLINKNTTNPSFTAPHVSANTQLKFLLTAKDDKGAEGTPAAVRILVKPNTPTAFIKQTEYILDVSGSQVFPNQTIKDRIINLYKSSDYEIPVLEYHLLGFDINAFDVKMHVEPKEVNSTVTRIDIPLLHAKNVSVAREYISSYNASYNKVDLGSIYADYDKMTDKMSIHIPVNVVSKYLLQYLLQIIPKRVSAEEQPYVLPLGKTTTKHHRH